MLNNPVEFDAKNLAVFAHLTGNVGHNKSKRRRLAVVKAFSDFNGLEMFFLACAIIGGFFVLLKLVMQFVGGDTHADVGVDSDISIDSGHVDSDIGFRIISMHGLSAFFMMFGLVGLALYRQSQMGFEKKGDRFIFSGCKKVTIDGIHLKRLSQKRKLR